MAGYVFLQVMGIIKYLQEVHAKFGFKDTMPKYILGLIIINLIIFSSIVIKKRYLKIVAGVAIIIVSVFSWFCFTQNLNHREIKNVEALDRAGIDYKPFLKNDFSKNMANDKFLDTFLQPM